MSPINVLLLAISMALGSVMGNLTRGMDHTTFTIIILWGTSALATGWSLGWHRRSLRDWRHPPVAQEVPDDPRPGTDQ